MIRLCGSFRQCFQLPQEFIEILLADLGQRNVMRIIFADIEAGDQWKKFGKHENYLVESMFHVFIQFMRNSQLHSYVALLVCE